MIRLTLAAMCLLLSSCASFGERIFPLGNSILPSAAVQNSASLDGKEVRISGYLIAEFEDRGIWDNRFQYNKQDGMSFCVSLLIPASTLTEAQRYSGSYVVVEGKMVSDVRARGTAILGLCNLVAVEVRSITAVDSDR